MFPVKIFPETTPFTAKFLWKKNGPFADQSFGGSLAVGLRQVSGISHAVNLSDTLKNDPMKSYEPIWWIYGIYGLSFGSHMGMGQNLLLSYSGE
jgi:hypothetical protein